MVSGSNSSIYWCEIAFYCFWKYVLECFGLFRGYVVDGGGQYPPKKLDMDWLVKFRLDMACGSSGLKGKSRL